MSKTKKVSLAVASFVMAMVLAITAFALGDFSPMSESKAADRPGVETETIASEEALATFRANAPIFSSEPSERQEPY